ncbi:MAG: hypothetical protein M4579_004490 [Chaenotheca gracillima]|nr:MAG: hypothetical protein M4579_004490 [Chaenotheca gracillima]
MDPLSITASVAAVIQLTQTISLLCQRYYLDVKDARKDIQCVIDQLTSLSDVLTNLEDLVDSPSGARLAVSQLLNGTSGPLHQCYSELDKLRQKLDASGGKWTSLKRSVSWPFEKKQVADVVAVIERHKSNLGLALTVQNTTIAIATDDGITELRQAIAAAKHDAKRNKILIWLSVADTSQNQNDALEEHETGTGNWLLNGKEFEQWMSAPNSMLWLHGKAGSGKSIICSTIIQHVESWCSPEAASAIAYFYFDFNNVAKQSTVNMTRSLIVQLCRQTPDTPQSLQDLYDQSQGGHRDPPMSGLETVLAELVKGFDHAYIILDALDECPRKGNERDKLLKLIKKLSGWSNNGSHVFATSRLASDIEKAIAPLTDASIDIEKVVDEDIRLYLRNRLVSPRFSDWPEPIKQEVESALSEGSNGMFRWVACQLDMLQDLSQASKIRKALKSLPKTLDTTYDRMIQSIGDDDQQQAIVALKWLTFSARPLKICELAEAVVIDPQTSPPFDPSDRLFTPSKVLDLLPGLVVASFGESNGRQGDNIDNTEWTGFSKKGRISMPGKNMATAHYMSPHKEAMK